MKIHKILNNNVVVVLEENQREQIVMGRGIAFKKKIDDLIDESLIDKVFMLSNQDISSKFMELLENIPIEFIKLTDEIIMYTKSHLGKKLSESIYISLSDHIHTAVIRFQKGIIIKNPLLWDIKRFYSDEYEIGTMALNMIEKRFQVRLPNDEAGFIAFHIVNAQMEEETDSAYEITKFMQEISNIVKYTFNITFNEETVYYYRFITHLKFFAQRLFHGNNHNDDNEDGLLEIVRLKYRNAYDCVLNISKFIKEKYSYDVSDEEILYLTIHIARVVYKVEE